MRTLPQRAPGVSTAARDASMLAVECWRTIVPSATTGRERAGQVPLRPARDPVNAGRTLPVAWAGRCDGCQAPLWAAVMPTRADLTRDRRRCPGCAGAPVFRFWHVLRQAPPRVPGTRGNGASAAPPKSALAPLEESRTSNTVRVTPGPIAPLAEARWRLRRRARPRQTPAARARAYRARRRGTAA